MSKKTKKLWLALMMVTVATGAARALDEATRAGVVEALAENLVEGYIYEEKGNELAADLRRRLEAGEYRDLDDPDDFARQLTHDMYGIADDLHLRVRFEGEERPESPSAPARAHRGRPHSPERHHGFVRVEILDGNVGYVDLRGFAGPEAEAAADGAMELLAGVDALILDLGKNGGGGPFMVRHLSTYLFAEPTHLVSTFMRSMPEPRERWTFEKVRGRRFTDAPVYVLTSGRTFSAAESFTFGLKLHGRITIVGERTGGGGHFGSTEDLGGGFNMFLPHGKTYDPKTGKGWEAEGIEPDVAVPYSDALAAAHRHALEQLGRG